MNITDSARDKLQEILKDNNMDCLTIALKQSCCGIGYDFQMTKLNEGQQPSITVNDIPLLMNDEVLEKSEKIILEYKNEQLIINDPAASSC